MQKETLPEASGYLARKRRRQIWRKIVSGLACIVVFCTTYALILPAITLEKETKDSAEASAELVCSLETLGIHTHTDSCYDDDNNLICGYADFAVHTHDSSCYDQDGNLVCTLPEVEAHTHTYECYREGEAAVISEGHTHTEECYTTERGELICGLEESDEHQHIDECYNWEQALTCGKEEQEEQLEQLEPVLVCGMEESDEHTHTEDCYMLGAELICDKEEIILHTHTDECYIHVGDLICGLEESDEHQHSEDCYAKEEALICGKTEVKEHIHGDECFVTVEKQDIEENAGEAESTEAEAAGAAGSTEEESAGEAESTEEESAGEAESTEEAATVESSEDELLTTLSCEGEDFTVTVRYGEDAKLPEGVELIASEYAKDSDTWLERYEQAKALYGWEEDKTDSVRLFDIGFYAEGTEVEPAAEVTVSITFNKQETEQSYQVIHFGEETEIVETESSYEDDQQTIDFALNELSDIMLLSEDVEAIETAFYLWLHVWNSTTSQYELIYSNPIWENGAFQGSGITGALKYTEDDQTYYLIPISYFDDEYGEKYGYSFDATEDCPFDYAPNAQTAPDGLTDASYVQSGGEWYVRVQDTTPNVTPARSNIYYKPYEGPYETVSKFKLWLHAKALDDGADYVAAKYDGDTCIQNKVLNISGTTSYLIPIEYFTSAYKGYGYSFDETDTETCSIQYAPDATTAPDGLTDASYVQVEEEWYVQVEDTGTYTNDSTVPRSNVYFYYGEYSKVTDAVTPSGTVINLFDYWLTGQDDPDYEKPFESDHFLSGINANHALKFSCNRLLSNENTDGRWNVWTGNANVYPGIVKNTLGDDGYPVLSGADSVFTPAPNTLANVEDNVDLNESLSYLFDPTEKNDSKETHRNVGGLLQVDDEGYYYYNSAENFAEYDEESNRFTLYETWGVQTGGSSPNGQFFPFNSMEEVARVKSTDSQINHYLGMTLTTRFIQQFGGHTTSGRKLPTTFEFAGDDDVWIFIDDVLVADLGGIHDRAHVKIDFSTGNITINEGTTTTLADLFHAAGKETTGTGWSGNTFADNTYHTLKFYYLERGNTDSNLYLKYNLKDIPPTAIYKVNQYGGEIEGASFAVYAATKIGDVYHYLDTLGGKEVDLSNQDYTFDTESGNILNANGETIVQALYTGTTDENGEMIFLDEDGMYYSLIDLQKMFGEYFILREIAVPEGYRLVSDETYLHIAGSKILLCENTYDSGVWASPNLLVMAPDTLMKVNGKTVLYHDISNHNIDGTLFAVVLKYRGTASSDELVKESNWIPVYGSDMDGYTLVDVGDDFIAAAIKAAKNQEAIAEKNDGEGSVVFKLAPSGAMQTTLTNLPGDIQTYYYMLESDKKQDTQYTIAYYWTSADSLDGASSNNTVRIDADATQYVFDRIFGATIQVPNLTNRLFAQKLDENGTTLVNDATFGLYRVSEEEGEIFYIADDSNKVTLTEGEYEIDSESGVITLTDGANKGTTITPVDTQMTLSKNAKLNASGEDGTATFTNLTKGQYYLREVSAPAGYELNDTEVMVLVTEDAIYANAGTVDDGVTVARGPGYVVSTLDQFASQGDIDNTLSWIREQMLISGVSTSFEDVSDALNLDGSPKWKYLKANNDPNPVEAENALTTHLVYDKENDNALFNYIVNAEWYKDKGIDPSIITRRLYTSVGWSYYLLYQDYGWGSEHATEGANYQDIHGQEISNLFSRSTYVRVTDKHAGGELEIRKIVEKPDTDGDEDDAENGNKDNTEFTFNLRLYKVEAKTDIDDTTDETTDETMDEETGETTDGTTDEASDEITGKDRIEIPLTGEYTYKVYNVTYDDDEKEIRTVDTGEDGKENTGTFTLTEENNGTCTFTLKDGQLIVIEGLPAGTWYTVTEVWNADYCTTAVRDKGKDPLDGGDGTIGTGNTGGIQIEAGQKEYTFDTITKEERTVIGTLYWKVDGEGNYDGTSTVAYTNTYLPDLTILKYQTGAPNITLADAEFVFYRTVTTDGDTEGEESTSTDYYYTDDGWKTLSNDETEEGEDAVTEETVKLTSGNDGKITLSNIPDGEYTLKEIKAPSGYNLLKEPITVVVANGKITSPNQSTQNAAASVDETDEKRLTLKVSNSTGYELPSTGGSGTTPYTTAGLLLMCSAAGLCYRNKKRGKEGRGKTP